MAETNGADLRDLAAGLIATSKGHRAATAACDIVENCADHLRAVAGHAELTQEMARLNARIEELEAENRAWVDAFNNGSLKAAQNEIASLTRERDEARERARAALGEKPS